VGLGIEARESRPVKENEGDGERGNQSNQNRKSGAGQRGNWRNGPGQRPRESMASLIVAGWGLVCMGSSSERETVREDRGNWNNGGE